MSNLITFGTHHLQPYLQQTGHSSLAIIYVILESRANGTKSHPLNFAPGLTLHTNSAFMWYHTF